MGVFPKHCTQGGGAKEETTPGEGIGQRYLQANRKKKNFYFLRGSFNFKGGE